MGYFWIFSISAFSILIPFVASIVRFKRLSYTYIPLFWLLLAGLINETLSFCVAFWYRNNHYNSNLYILVEYLLLLWLFYRICQQKMHWSITAAVAGTLIWICDNIWLHSMESSNTVFRIFSSLSILWLSINQLTSLIFSGLYNNYKATGILICASFCIYYIYRSFVLLFKFIFNEAGAAFETKLWLVVNLINLVTNITIAIAILCLPKRQNPILVF